MPACERRLKALACFSDEVLEAYRAALAHAERDASSGR